MGDRVEGLYDPAHPDQAPIRAEVIPWLFAAIFGGIGGIFAIAGSGIAIASQFVEPLGIVSPPIRNPEPKPSDPRESRLVAPPPPLPSREIAFRP